MAQLAFYKANERIALKEATASGGNLNATTTTVAVLRMRLSR